MVKFVAGDFAGAAFEAAGFHDAGAGGEVPGLGEVVEEFDEAEGGAEDGGGDVVGLGFVEGLFEGVEIGLNLVCFGVFGEEIGGVGVGPALHEFIEHEGQAAVGEIGGGRCEDEDADLVFLVGVFG